MNDWADDTEPAECPNCGDDRRETVKRFQTVVECPG